MSWFQPRSRRRSALLLGFVVLAFSSPAVSTPSDSDICFIQPLDQCSGNQFVQLGQSDADTDGKPYLFEASITNGNAGNATLQFKDSTSTTFTDVATSVYYSDFGGSSSVFWQEADSLTIDEGGSQTITVDGNEHIIEVVSAFPSIDSSDVRLDGSDLGELDAGDTFTVEGNIFQVSEVFPTQVITEQADREAGEWYNGTMNGYNYNIKFVGADSDASSGFFRTNFDDNLAAGEGDVIVSEGDKSIYVDVLINYPDQPDLVAYDIKQDVERTRFTNFEDVTSPEGWLEYRVKWQDNFNPTVWSDSLFFSVDRISNIPADKQVVVNGQKVNQPTGLSGVVPNSNVNLTVFQGQEQDPVNVTLVTENGTEVYTISQGENYGAFRAIYDEVSDDLLSLFRGGTNDTYVFPTGNSFFLSEQGTTYDFHFEIMDKADNNVVRTTKSYSVTTSGTATNEPPNVTNLEFYNVPDLAFKSFDNVVFGDEIGEVCATIEDPDNEYLQANITLWEEYDDIRHVHDLGYSDNTGDEYCFTSDSLNVTNPVPVDDSGDWNFTLKASDGAGNVETVNESFNLSWGTLVVENLTVNGASTDGIDVNRYKQLNVTADVTCTGGECASQTNGTHPVAENVTVWLDPAGVEKRRVDVKRLGPGRRKVVTEVYRKETVLDKVLGWIGEVLT